MPFSMPVKIKKLHNDVKIPAYATSGSAGMDIYAYTEHALASGESCRVGTGWVIAVPDGYELRIQIRSGIAFKQQMIVTNAPGCVDSDYREEVGILITNLSKGYKHIKKGDRIAQGIISPVVRANLEITNDLGKTERSGGFGSTGEKEIVHVQTPAETRKTVTEAYREACNAMLKEHHNNVKIVSDEIWAELLKESLPEANKEIVFGLNRNDLEALICDTKTKMEATEPDQFKIISDAKEAMKPINEVQELIEHCEQIAQVAEFCEEVDKIVGDGETEELITITSGTTTDGTPMNAGVMAVVQEASSEYDKFHKLAEDELVKFFATSEGNAAKELFEELPSTMTLEDKYIGLLNYITQELINADKSPEIIKPETIIRKVVMSLIALD